MAAGLRRRLLTSSSAIRESVLHPVQRDNENLISISVRLRSSIACVLLKSQSWKVHRGVGGIELDELSKQ
jgi:hypothetical protein